MKTFIATIATALFAGSIQAASDAEIYNGFQVGNSELTTEYATLNVSAGQGRDGSLDSYVYNGWEVGNSELSYDLEPSVMHAGMQPQIGDSFGREGVSRVTNADIYHGFEVGNEDLH